ncbi:MAG: hypothetical protein HYU97_02510 [Deltaproteobacteria bacterium]|nr:hypothetical protein [Deltaproteobacteria bacterium]
MIEATQRQIETLYQLPATFNIQNFLLAKSDLKGLLTENNPYLHADEVVLTATSDGELEIGVFFSPEILENLEQLNIQQKLNLIEGISHFLLIVYKHHSEIPLTQLELELQAEIDKFLLLTLNQSCPTNPEEALALISRPINLPNLNSNQDQLYRQASEFAKRYCHYLLQKYLHSHSIDPLLQEIRTFYRLPYFNKIQTIQMI